MSPKEQRNPARRPLVVGYYGMRNVGDNAFCVIVDWAMKRYWDTEEPVFAAPPLVDLPDARAAMSQSLFESADPVSRAGKLLTKATMLGGASMLVFGGGSVFRDMGPFSEKKIFAAWSRVSRRPIAAVGVSVGPFVTAAAAQRLGEVFRHIDYIGVRDAASVERLRDLDYPGLVVPAGDLAGLLPEALGDAAPAPIARTPGRIRLGVTLLGSDTDLPEREQRRREEVLIAGIRSFVDAEPVDVTIFVFNTHPLRGDVAPSERLRSSLQDRCDLRVVTADDGVTAVFSEMRACDAGLHMRMHGGIFSYVAGVPFALVPYHRKCADFLDEIGQPATRLLPVEPDDPVEVHKLLGRLVTDGASPRLDLAEFADSARLNFTRAPWARA
ncbi:polysaccharide pyruvyl transferase WcaK-like protein [Micromonospora kangleipakensis]|uniref:Polysaccharide pyruvyl transferase WcaK-like protein n=1 Tax=Micromonospora kangleipakensis TaxID=1077942 RepID=A0A4V6MGS3_9ACTN|nr:polysaccharide pyruvyl transferase family protein [Micromonospora kangleipakensis]RZU73746.1 polysaccharide pyruvyl transferase WcaK-like protein [Micromonospora kangleipakensis]